MKRRAVVLILLAAAWTAPASNAADWYWKAARGGAQVANGTVTLELEKTGETAAAAEGIPVTPGKEYSLSFDYAAAGLTVTSPLEVSLHWFNAAGEDIDTARLAIGFPPEARFWQFTHDGSAATHVADNVTVPGGAAKVRIELSVKREDPKERGLLHVAASGFGLTEGEAATAGIEMPASGPVDAGPVSAPPAEGKFGTNLVPNGDLEEGTDLPAGWRIEGDNSNGSAQWATGGAYSGKKAFKLFDRGPYVKSWDKHPGDPEIMGGALGGNAANAREEVSARWVSDPSPATPGTQYQATAFYWYGNRTFLDRGIQNPVSIQFLDAKKRPIRPTTVWDDWYGDARVITRTGWVMAPSKVVAAPANAAYLRAVVKMPHAFATGTPEEVHELLAEHRMLMVDNISVYALPAGADINLKDAKNGDTGFAAAAAAGALPFVPSSPAHRPNSILVSTKTDGPGGLVVRPYEEKGPVTVTLELTNLLGDKREAAVDYTVVGIDGQEVKRGQATAEIAPFGKGAAALDMPSLPYGPYLIRYQIAETGASESIKGEARFGIMPERETTMAEGGRMDYPFSLWMPGMPPPNPETAEKVGELARYAGVGKTWFGADNIYLDHFVQIKDPVARQAAIETQLVKCRESIAFWKKHGITPMAAFQPSQLLDPSQYPALAETVKAFVTALKGDIHIWRHGTESIHGGIHDLDVATLPGVNGQGASHDYLYWGRKGTVRQYWAEYLVAYKAAKEADPDCVFGPQSASDIEGSVLHTFFEVMTNKDLNSFGMNTYISAYSIWPPNEKELQRNGVPNLPIYVSEFSAQAGASPTSENHLEEEHAGCQKEVTYWASVLQSFPNLFHLEEWGMILGNDDGSLTYEGLVRPQYLAYATMTNLLGAGQFVAKHELPGVEVRVRQRSVRKGYVALVYATGPERPLDLDAGAKPAVFDMWGNRLEAAPVDGVLTVQVKADPLYVVSDEEIKPHMGVSIRVDPATLDADHPRVTVTLKNETKAPAPGRLELIQNGPLRIADRVREVKTLEPGKAAAFTFDIQLSGKLPARRLPITVRYTVGQKTYELPAGLNFNTARKVSSPMAIDADPAGWDDAEFSQVADRVEQFYGNGSPKAWGGPGDISARTAFRWDDRYVYAFFKVTDDVDMPPDGPGKQFQSDAIELFFDMSRTLASDGLYTMFSLARYPDGPKVLRHEGPLPVGEVPGAKIAAKREGNQTLYEAAVPWEEISPGFKPKAGKVISLNWWIDDFDGGDTGRRKIGWFSYEKNPAKYGDLILVDGTGKKRPNS